MIVCYEKYGCKIGTIRNEVIIKMSNINTAVIQGRLTKTPVMEDSNTGKSVTSFTISSDGSEGQTNLISCVAWGKNAEFICDYFQKGQMVIIHGSIQTRTYEGCGGVKHKVTELVVNQAYFCGDGENLVNKLQENSEPERKDAEEKAPSEAETEQTTRCEKCKYRALFDDYGYRRGYEIINGNPTVERMKITIAPEQIERTQTNET